MRVVVPSYRRPEAVTRCLDGLAAQTEAADEVVVAHRHDDHATIDAIRTASLPRLSGQPVGEAGVVAAMNAGAAGAHAGVVAFCDDDAIPKPDWVSSIRAAFTDPELGALGGRDWLGAPHPEYPPTDAVGLIGRWGRLTGEHHRGAGGVRPVDVLKAVNMTFRVEALAFPVGLRGAGAQVHFELSMSLWAREQGWVVSYDPELLVDHHPEQRHGADRRDWPTWGAISDASYNYTMSLLGFRPELTLRRTVYALCVGDTAAPGLLRAAVALLHRDVMTSRKLLPTQRGQLDALVALRRGRRISMRPIAAAGTADTLTP